MTANPNDLHARLERQSLRRPLTAAEQALAQALEEVFAAGTHDFAAVASALQKKGVLRPSKAKGAWSEAVLMEELQRINADLDAAYLANDLLPPAALKGEGC